MVRPRRNADCHPERPHNAFGLCLECYRGRPEFREQRRRHMREYNARTVDERKVKARAKYAANHNGMRDKAIEYQRERRKSADARLQRRAARYGLTPLAVVEMLRWQNWACALCRTDIDLDTAHIDHDHADDAGRVRGFLCQSCNIALGLLRDDRSLAFGVSNYLAAASRL